MSTQSTTISRLTIGGFKSFADEVRVDILPGLTGIIGPNGCGKSNVVEALRWAMGETSARALRGSELDDLIFAGTGTRPSRNLAQVTLHLTGTKGLAPAPFQNAEELEVTRRAERGSGSEYRLNGRTLRARDVQTLFADLASGARSSSIVSQNRVGQLIAAKPEERRLLLEEAAGITGLHARRHDAELKLRQTETNLSRAEDLRLQIEERLTSLEGQTTQARQYRDLSERLRETESHLHALLHARAHLTVEQSRNALTHARQTLREAEHSAQQATLAEFEARKAAPLAREETDRLRTALERLKLQTETTRLDMARARDMEQDARTRYEQMTADLQTLSTRLAKDHETQATLHAEHHTAQTEQASLPHQKTQAETQQHTLQTLEKQQSTELEDAIRLRDAEAIRRDGLLSTLSALTTRIETETETLKALEAELTTLNTTLPSDETLTTLRLQTQDALSEQARLRQTETDAAKALQEARLAMELNARALREGQQQLQTFEKTEADLTHRLNTARTRLKQEQSAHAQTTRTLLSDQEKQALENTRDDTANTLQTLLQQERTTRQDLDTANTHWLESRARTEESHQTQRALQRTLDTARQTVEQARKHYTTACQNRDTTASARIPDAALNTTRTAIHTLEARLNTTQAALKDTETALHHATTEEHTAQNALRTLENSLLRLRSERDGLEKTLATTAIQPNPLEDSLTIPPTLARAVAVALSDGLDASLAPLATPADRRWHTLSPLNTPTPSHSLPRLSSLLSAPEAVQRCLNEIFLLDDETQGPALQLQLTPGQSLVSPSGALWRWDGFIRSPNAPDAGATRLTQKQTLTDLTRQSETQERALPDAENHLETTRTARFTLEKTLHTLREDRTTVEPALHKARAAHATQEQQATLAQSRWEDASRRATEAENTLKTAETALATATAEHDAHPTPDLLSRQTNQHAQTVTTLKQTLATLTQTLQTARNAAGQAERALDQALLRHDTALTRQQDLTTSISRHEHDTQTLVEELKTLQSTANRPSLPHLTQQSEHATQNHATTLKTHETTVQAVTEAQKTANHLSENLRQLDQTAATTTARLAALTPRAETLRTTLSQLHKDHAAHEQTLSTRPDPHTLEHAVQTHTQSLETTRTDLLAVQETLSNLTLADVRLTATLTALTTRLTDLTAQISTATQSRTDLQAREETLRDEWQKAETHPQTLEKTLLNQTAALEEAQTAYTTAQSHDEATRQTGQAAQDQRRTADLELAKAREAIARLTERAEQAIAARDRLLAESPPPDHAHPPSDLSEQAETSTRRRLARLTRERNDLGPVNLRAETEYEDARQTADTIAHEHGELTAAITRLRGGIGSINKEGRERLLAVFTDVDRHFQSLFARMFGGGRAHLGMVGSDDPLEAGLEIFAQPPGKKLSTLSLLSGGEQALTALSLIFATFRCNPAPICILDEVDAPLDDANVERFCALLSDMTQESGTRFLVVTHHQLTMAHMDRLYGVTMQERGVSRVLSVDLQRAVSLAEN